MRAVACLCANNYPVGLGAGKNSDFTYKEVYNEKGEAVSIHALCIKKNKGWNKRILGKITLPLTRDKEVMIETPGNDRINANAAVLREFLQGAFIVPFSREGYRISRCPTNREHYQGLNWTQAERWPGM